MKKFLAIYRGQPKSANWDRLSKEEQNNRLQQGMESWGLWMKNHQSKIIDAGGPLGKTLNVDHDGVSPKVNLDCGYVILEAQTHEECANMFLNHPHFSIFPGENVEIMECMPIPGNEVT